jgi:hypothetical protein
MQEKMMTTNLPANPQSDGWDDRDESGRIVRGTLIKCTDGIWTKAGETEPLSPDLRLLAASTITILQHWFDNKPVQTIIKQAGVPLPDIDELNSRIPETEWEDGLDGNPRPPWQLQRIVYFIDPVTMAQYTFASGTFGARIAVEALKDAIYWRRAIEGPGIVPLIRLSAVPMKTRFGRKMRPDFVVDSWRNLGGKDGGPTPVEGPQPPRQLEKVDPVTGEITTMRPGETVEDVARQMAGEDAGELPTGKYVDDEIPFAPEMR